MAARARFVLRIYLGYALLILAFAAASWWTAFRWQERWTYEQVDHDLRVAAQLAGDSGIPSDEETPQLRERRFRSMAEALGARLTLVSPDGTVLADSHEEPARMANHADRPEIRGALAEGTGSADRYSETLHAELRYRAVAVKDPEGRIVAVARAAVPRTQVEQRVAALHRQLLGLFALGLGLALGLGYWTASHVTRPLRRMSAAAEDIARGGGSPEALRQLQQDEVGELSRAMSTMAGRLQERLELLASERTKLVAVLSGMVEGVLSIDAEENVLHVNEAAARMLGISSQDVGTRSLSEITRFPPVRDVLQRVLQDGETARSEVLPERDGTTNVLELTASALRASDGDVQGAVLVLHDVTELRRLETVRRDFVANVSHELKTPLAALRGVLETMAEDAEMPREVQVNFLERARRQTDRLTAIVADLLSLSRLERAAPVESSWFDACALIQESVGRFQEETQARSIRVRSELAHERIALLGDPETFRQIVDNLLSNAIRYSPTGGEVAVRLFEQQGSVLLEVEDHGIGIDPAEQNRIFERFYRADRARSREKGGTGLGLSIVKHATEVLGGQVTLRSWPGSGSCFRVRLPKHALPRSAEAEA